MAKKKDTVALNVVSKENPFPGIEPGVFTDLEYRHDEELTTCHGKFNYYMETPYLNYGPRACYKPGDIITWMMSNKATGMVISVDLQGLKASHDELYKFNTYLWVKLIDAEYPDWESETDLKEVPDFVVETVNGVPVSQLSCQSPDWIAINPRDGKPYDKNLQFAYPYWKADDDNRVNLERFRMRLRTVKEFGDQALELFFARYKEIGRDIGQTMIECGITPQEIREHLTAEAVTLYFPNLPAAE